MLTSSHKRVYYRGVFISRGWDRVVPLYTEVSSFQGVGIEGFHCIQRCQGVGIKDFHCIHHFRICNISVTL